jgi:hypothetical protein
MNTRAVMVVTMAGLAITAAFGAENEESTDSAQWASFVDAATHSGITLLNVTGGPNKDYIVEVNGNGAAFFDYDGDGDLDALVVNGSTLERLRQTGGDPLLALYRNDGTGRFADVTADSGMRTRGWGMGACVADVDNDGHDDVYITAFGANVLYRNDGDGTFSDITADAGVGDTRWGTNCAFGDYDRDGDVDLYVANFLSFDEKTVPRRGGSNSKCQFMGVDVICGPRGLPGEADVLYRNNGDGTFTDVTESAGISDPGHYGFGVIFSDLDNDGWPDIFVANDSTPNLLFHNQGDGTFEEIGLFAGVALSQDARQQAGMGLDAADYDGDGDLDLFLTHFAQDYNTLYQNEGDMFFTDASHQAGLAETSIPYLGWGTSFMDADNDGLVDVFIANGHVYPGIESLGQGAKFRQRKQLYRNLGGGRFQEMTEAVGGALLIEQSARGSTIGDYDNDGDVDVLVINLDEPPTLLRNETENGNHWISLHLVGTKSNRSAIGAVVEIVAGGKRQLAEVRSGGSYLSHNDMRLHFGLGGTAIVEQLEVRWPSGLRQRFEKIPADRFLTVVEGDEPRPSGPADAEDE